MIFDITDQKKEKISLWVLVVLHLVGFAGLISPFKPWIIALTPVHLIVCAVLLLWGIGYKSAGFKYWFILVFLIGFAVEWAGIKTGLLFGEYHYGASLGFKLSGVPVIIGLNWFLVSYGSYSIVSRISLNMPVIFKVLLASLLCVALDFFIEPIAIQLDYWQWADGIPLRNYIGWLGVSVLIQSLAFYGVRPALKPHRLGVAVWLIQFLFFLMLNLFSI